MLNNDYLWRHLRELPYFRSLVRAVEARFFADISLASPTLDVGCGDGHFASVAFQRQLEVGLDPGRGVLREARGRAVYHWLVQSDGGRMPFPNDYFASAISNSVLEHIPHVDAVLMDLGRVLKPGALFIFCVPNDRFLDSLSIGQFLNRCRLSVLGDLYRSFFNRISRHVHCDSPQIWQHRLEQAGFQLERYWHYFSPEALSQVEWGHYFGLPSLLIRWLTGRWILAPTRWNLALSWRLLRRYYLDDPVTDRGVYTFFIARRV